MRRFKREWWAAVIFFIVLFAPGIGQCIERDPYLRRTLLASLSLQYQSDIYRQENLKIRNGQFLQLYSLALRGNLLSRRLIIYDADVSFSDSDTTYSTNDSKRTFNLKDLDLTLKTTLLPLSAIPLTLYGERRNLYTDTGKSTATTYGFNWLAKVPALPTAQVNAQRSDFRSPDTETINTNYGLSLSKQTGPSFNDVSLTHNATENITRGEKTTSQITTANFDDQTRISRNTDFFAHATRTNEDNSRLTGLNLGLDSKTSRDINQTHRYSFFENISPGLLQKGQNYAGMLLFNPFDSVNSNFSLGISNGLTRTHDSKSEGDMLQASGAISLRLTKRLSLNLSAGSDTAQTNSESSTTPAMVSKGQTFRSDDGISYGITDHLNASEQVSYRNIKSTTDGSPVLQYTLVVETTNIGYRNEYKWLEYNALYGLGYADEYQDGAKRVGTVQNIVLGFTARPDISKYAGINASGSYRRLNKLNNDLRIDDRSQNFRLEVYNKEYKKYVNLTGSFDYSKTSSMFASQLPASQVNGKVQPLLTSPFEQSTESFFAGASSNYFTGTSITSNMEHQLTRNILAGTQRFNSGYFSIIHSRTFQGGSLTGSFNYNITSSSSSLGGSTRTFDALLSASYTRTLLRSLAWNAEVSLEDRKDSQFHTQSAKVTNGLSYVLRAWLFSAAHTYTASKLIGGPVSNENMIMFSASRQFLRFF